jgi:hypothetical protein
MNLERCPKCAALNAKTSKWCTQCLTRLDEAPAPTPEPVVDPGPAQGPPPTAGSLASLGGALASAALPGAAPTAATAPTAPPGIAAAVTSASGTANAARTDPIAGTSTQAPADANAALAKARWTCTRCGEENTYNDENCAACGLSLFAPLVKRGPKAKEAPARSVLLGSLVPGGGFFVLGLAGSGVARLLMTMWALGIAVFLGTQGALLALKILFVVAGLAVWAVSAVDALSAQRGDEGAVILKNRVIVITMGVLLAILFIGLVTTARAPTNSPDKGPVVIPTPAGTFTPGG